ncbi:Sin3 associated polypeptide p18-domain-containing protein [Dipodascopsis uninucleata]
MSNAAPIKVDRQKVPPFLLRLFFKQGGFHSLDDFSSPRRFPVDEELQIYTWRDCTLKELHSLLASAVPEAANARCKFRLVYLARNGHGEYTKRDIGIYSPRTDINNGPGAKRDTLAHLRFMIGDFIDVSYSDTVSEPPGLGFRIKQQSGDKDTRDDDNE